MMSSPPGRARSVHIGQKSEAGRPRPRDQLNEAAPCIPHAARAEEQSAWRVLPMQLRVKYRSLTPLRETIEIDLTDRAPYVLSPADLAMPKPKTPTSPTPSPKATGGKSPWIPYEVFKGMTPQAKAATNQRARQPSNQRRAPLRRLKGKGKGEQKDKGPGS